MKGLFFFLCLALLFSAASAYGIKGIAISPGCIPSDCSCINLTSKETHYETVRVYNFEESDVSFSVYSEGENNEFILINPSEFVLKKRQSNPACLPEYGCQVVNITVSLEEAEPGSNYSWNIVASTSAGGEGTLSVIQEVASVLRVRAVKRPNVFYRAIFFIGKQLSRMKNLLASKWIGIAITLVAIIAAYFAVQFLRMRKKERKGKKPKKILEAISKELARDQAKRRQK